MHCMRPPLVSFLRSDFPFPTSFLFIFAFSGVTAFIAFFATPHYSVFAAFLIRCVIFDVISVHGLMQMRDISGLQKYLLRRICAP